MSLARQPREPADTAWQESLSRDDLARFTWSTFNDEQLPRAIGMRLVDLVARDHTFEVAEWYSPERIVRSFWRFQPFGRWSELIDTESR